MWGDFHKDIQQLLSALKKRTLPRDVVGICFPVTRQGISQIDQY
jgi:hypothetical protein